MKQKTLLGIFAFSIVAILGLGVVSAFGFGPDFMNHDITQEDQTEMQNKMESMRTAIESNDYEAWKSLMEEQIAKMQEQITEENFYEIIARHEQMQEMREAMDEVHADFCKDNEDTCPMHEEGFKHRGGVGMMPPKTEESSE